MITKKFMICFCLLSASACGVDPRAASHVQSPSREPESQTSMVGGAVVRRANEVSRSIVALVMLGAEGESLCSGTILDERTILTAAHCVEHEPSRLAVVFGPRVSGAKPDSVRMADATLQHPAWRHRPGYGDVALVHFRGGLPPGYRPVRLAGSGFQIELKSELLMVGYGTTHPEQGSGAGTLRQTRSMILGFLRPDQFVVDERLSGACFGDSGGPAFVLEGESVVQVGLAHSVLNETCDAASFYTDVMLYTDWILAAATRLARLDARPVKAGFGLETLGQPGYTNAHESSRDNFSVFYLSN